MDKAQLFKPRLAEAEVELAGVGTVRVRALSRIEVMLMQKIDGLAEQECRMLRFGMVDPKVTEAEAERWQKASPAGELEKVTDKIAELSGLKMPSKSAVPGVRGGPEQGVRPFSGGEAVDDGRPAAPGDQ